MTAPEERERLAKWCEEMRNGPDCVCEDCTNAASVAAILREPAPPSGNNIKGLAAQKGPQPAPPEERERLVARVIDPDAWENFDNYKARHPDVTVEELIEARPDGKLARSILAACRAIAAQPQRSEAEIKAEGFERLARTFEAKGFPRGAKLVRYYSGLASDPEPIITDGMVLAAMNVLERRDWPSLDCYPTDEIENTHAALDAALREGK